MKKKKVQSVITYFFIARIIEMIFVLHLVFSKHKKTHGDEWHDLCTKVKCFLLATLNMDMYVYFVAIKKKMFLL